jgi:glutamine synthetase
MLATLGRLGRKSRGLVPCAAVPMKRTFMSSLDAYGTHLFTGEIADQYLAKQGLKAGALKDPSWTQTSSDAVARAIMDWAGDHGASVYTHWFQPLGASNVRLGMTGQVHNAFFSFGSDGKPVFEFKGKELLKGETDGSSYCNGGMRATHTAGGYTVLDPSSPVFIRGDTVYVPTVFVSFYGDALDEKAPLLRAMQAVSREGVRLCKHFGLEANTVQPNIGLEQEFFLVPREAYYKRPDLQLTGRTIMGKQAPRGQEMCDHYMAPPNQLAFECMKEIQHECFLLGIPLRTRHREVAPGQYEFAPLFGIATTQIDQNIMVMQIAQEVAAKHDMACLLEEKPFAGINGSGKHNNFSLGTDGGINLLNADQVTAASGSAALFGSIMSCIVRAINVHGDLMRMAIASPGNDFRLGAMEAPPAIVSTYLGDELTSYLEKFKASGVFEAYKPDTAMCDLGIDSIAPFPRPAEDRNRTSPFPYGGHRFEFRAVGSSQNVSMVNTVLCSIFAESFAMMSDAIEKGAKPADVAKAMLADNWQVIFNGNGYDPAWVEEAGKRGIWRIDSGVESMQVLSSPKNVELFSSMKVLSEKEAVARTIVMHEHYAGTVELEALTMVDMINQHVLPSAKAANIGTGALEAACKKVSQGVAGLHGAADEYEKATLARVLRLETMEEARKVCDTIEETVPANLWTLATYKELLFFDSHQGA